MNLIGDKMSFCHEILLSFIYINLQDYLNLIIKLIINPEV